eukprot:9313749-Pyramimonas_sp.AAC.1
MLSVDVTADAERQWRRRKRVGVRENTRRPKLGEKVTRSRGRLEVESNLAREVGGFDRDLLVGVSRCELLTGSLANTTQRGSEHPPRKTKDEQ